MNRLLAGLAAALLLSAALAAPGPYDVFPETRSPGGRWAVAWGVPGKTLDSAKIRAADAENPELDAAASDPAKVENYLVDLKARKIAAKLSGFHSFYRENHGGISAHWSPDGKLAAVIHHGRWEPRAMSLVGLPSGAQTEILSRVQADVRRFLGRRGGGAYRAAGKVALDINDATLWPGKLRLTVTAEVPKADDGYSATLLAAYPVSVRGGVPRLGDPHVVFEKK